MFSIDIDLWLFKTLTLSFCNLMSVTAILISTDIFWFHRNSEEVFITDYKLMPVFETKKLHIGVSYLR